MVRTPDDTSTVLSLDEIFDVLVAPRRRAVLYELHGRVEAISLYDLAAAVSVAETMDPGTHEEKRDGETELPEAGSPERTKDVAIALNHVHLPKLQQLGLIDYDRENRTIELNGIPRQFERYLRSAAEDEHRAQSVDVSV